MNQIIQNFKKYQPLLKELVVKDIKIRYRKSILGVFWTLLNPLLMMVVLSVVFSNIFKFDIPNYPVYILSGQVIFTFFSEATNTAMVSIIGNAALIKKVYIPKYNFPFAAIISSMINVMASFSALIIVMLFMRSELHFTMLLSFIPILALVIFATGIGLILAAYVVKFRDLMHFYGVFLTALMYLMPVIYPMSILEGKMWIYNIVKYNPLTMMLDTFRDFVMYGTFPNWEHFLIIFGVAFAVLILGLWIFRRKQDTFILEI
ncbi:MAG: ABC transporter permease [Coriobacteriia bacterium]|nr:ABC transporter permease [Coriobacteriia bacterium]